MYYNILITRLQQVETKFLKMSLLSKVVLIYKRLDFTSKQLRYTLQPNRIYMHFKEYVRLGDRIDV